MLLQISTSYFPKEFNSGERLTRTEIKHPKIVEEGQVDLTSKDEELVLPHADGVTVSTSRHLPDSTSRSGRAVGSDAGPVVGG